MIEWAIIETRQPQLSTQWFGHCPISRFELGARRSKGRGSFFSFFVDIVYSVLETVPMNTPITPQVLLNQIAQLQHLERGKLCVIRQGPHGPYYNHQTWENGKNISCYVPQDQVPALREAIAGYKQFQTLVEQYVQLLVQKSRAERAVGFKKKTPRPHLLLAQDQEIQQLMARFGSQEPNGLAVQQLEVLVRTAIFKPANALVGFLLQAAADRIDAAYQPKPGQQYKGRESLQVQGLFGSFQLVRDYYYHAGKKEGHYPADAALGLEVAYTPALARLMCLEGADETSYQKAETALGGDRGNLQSPRRQIQRVVQRVGEAAQAWQEREAQPGGKRRADHVCQCRRDRGADAQGGTGGARGQTGGWQCQDPLALSGLHLYPAQNR